MNSKDSNRTQVKVHSFYLEDAEKYGAEKATLLYNVKFWLDHNKTNGKNYHDGAYWTYNSAESFKKQFPYLTAQKIARLLRELEKDGAIIVGNYNKAGYDRTKWYSTPCYASLFKNEKCIIQNQTMDCSNYNNALFKSEQPIPDVNTDINTDINTDTNSVCEIEKQLAVLSDREVLVNQLFNTWLEVSGQKIKPSAKRLSHINARLDDGFTAEQIVAAMTYVATDSWHVENGNNTIELATRSTEQIEKKLIKASAPAAKSANKGNSNATSSHTPHQSPASRNIAQLRKQIADEQAAKQSNNQHDQVIRTVC